MFGVVRVTDIPFEHYVRGVLGMVVLEKHSLGVPLKMAMERHQRYILTAQH